MRWGAAGVLVLVLAAGCRRKDPPVPQRPGAEERAPAPATGLRERSIGELRRMLAGTDGARQVEACREIGRRREEGEAAIPELIVLLDADDPALPPAAAAALTAIGRPAVPAVASLLGKPGGSSKPGEILRGIGLPALEPLLDSIAGGGWRGASIVGEIVKSGDESTASMLLARYRKREPKLKAVLQHALTVLGPAASESLLRLLDSTDAADRLFAIRALAPLQLRGKELADAPHLAELAAFIKDPSVDVRRAAALALAGAADRYKHAPAALIEALSDPDRDVRWFALRPVARWSRDREAAAKAIFDAWQSDPDPVIRPEALEAFVECILADRAAGSHAAMDLATPLLSGEAGGRGFALLEKLLVVAPFEIPQKARTAAIYIDTLRNGTNAAIRAGAAPSVARACALDPAAAEALLDALARDPDRAVRVAVIRAFALADSMSVVDITGALREASKDRDPSVAAAAREALKNYPDPDGFPKPPAGK